MVLAVANLGGKNQGTYDPHSVFRDIKLSSQLSGYLVIGTKFHCRCAWETVPIEGDWLTG